MRGPRPSLTSSSAENSSFAEKKYSDSALVIPASGAPAPVPLRGPGSFATDDCAPAPAWRTEKPKATIAVAIGILRGRSACVHMGTPPSTAFCLKWDPQGEVESGVYLRLS